MEFALGRQAEATRKAVRAVIAEVFTRELADRHHSDGTLDCPEVNRALAERGLLERALPGLGKGDPIDMWVVFHELDKAGVPLDGLTTSLMIGGVVNRLGTEEQKQLVLPGVLAGRLQFCMGYSEADHGSDVAAITTRASRDGDGWVINGAKMWTTMGHRADWLILLARTDPTVAKHRGLTMFILPMSTPGISVEPVYTLASERTNATYYDDVRVGDEAVLGEVNGGWHVMTVALSLERGVMGATSPGVGLLCSFREWAAASGADRRPEILRSMARVVIDNEVGKLLTQRAAWIAATGGTPGLEGSMTKLHVATAYQRAAAQFQRAMGAEGLLQYGAPGAPCGGAMEYNARHAPVTTIYGGTSEINLNNIALRHLGLPRAGRST